MLSCLSQGDWLARDRKTKLANMITISDLSKTFVTEGRSVHALRNVSIEINAGEFFVLLGASGSGKTTLIRCVAGLEHANAGEISLEDKIVYSSSKRVLIRPEDRNIGMVFQSYAVWPHLTVFENIALPLAKGRKRLSSREIQAKVAAVLEAVDLQGLESRPVPMLSGGQQQRVSLARALAVEPDALLMDEPLSNLDARLRERIRDQIRDIARKFGITVMYVTHDQTEAMALADRIAVMESGQVQQIGSPRELYGHPKTPQVADFFGDVNWLRGRQTATGVVETAIGPVHTDDHTRRAGDAVRLGIRPENIVFSARRPAERNCFLATIRSVTFLGERQSIVVDVAGTSLVLRTGGAVDPAIAESWVHLPEPAIFVFESASGEL